DRLKRGLKSRAPTIPLLSLRGCGGGDGEACLVIVSAGESGTGVPAVRGLPADLCQTLQLLDGLASVELERSCIPVRHVLPKGLINADHFPLCPCELVDSLPHIV